MDSQTHEVLFVDTAQALTSLCMRLRTCERIALDTEFIRERTYYPRLCLLQVGTTELTACIDPLPLPSLEPLLDVIYDRRIVKVLHAAYQDLEILFHLRGEPPRPIFDTQIAAGLLGCGEQIGYANLVMQLLGVQLPKAHARSDWCMRPLDAAQLRYAVDDVRYLEGLHARLRKRLMDRQRLRWLAEELAWLEAPETYQASPLDAWRRIGGIQSLAPCELNILRALVAWRERAAMTQDLPRKWVMQDALLVDLARLAPRDRSGLMRLRGLKKGQVDRYGEVLIATIQAALKVPESDWPQAPRRRLLDASQEATVDMLMAVVRNQAAAHEVSPPMIATRATLERLVLGDEDVPLLRGWRAEIAGLAVQKMLAGELKVSLDAGALRMEPSRPTKN
jgi:ribonuclease D